MVFGRDYSKAMFNEVLFSCVVKVSTLGMVDRTIYDQHPKEVEEALRDELTHKLWDHMQQELGGYTDAQLMHAYHLGMHSAYGGEVLTNGELVDKIRGEKGL